MKREQAKQLWVNVEYEIKKYYGERYDETDLKLIKAFFKAGFNVYPESGYMFQRIKNYDDGSFNKACINIEEARKIFQELKTLQKSGGEE